MTFPQNSQDTHRALDATQPAAALAPPAHTDRRYAQRWNEIAPWVRQFLQQRGDTSAPAWALMAQVHRARLLWLDALGFEMRVVRRNWLDDPRLTDDEAQRRVKSHYSRRHKKGPKR